MNPGGLVPLPLSPDARQAAIYFFPDASRLALKLRQQTQPLVLRQGWRQALRGEPMSVPFRLMQSVDGDVARDALEELGRTREPASLDQLFGFVLNPVLQGPFDSFHAESVLSRIGDGEGDVYDRAAKLLRNKAPGTSEYRFAVLAQLMAVADQRRRLRWIFPSCFSTSSHFR